MWGLLVAVLGLGLGFGPAVQAEPDGELLNKVEIRVMPEAVVYGDTYQLGDIAELDGFDIDLTTRLSKIEIGKSPLPGNSQKLSKGQIDAKMRGLVHPDQYKLILPKEPLVSRASILIEKDQLSQVIVEEIKKNFSEYKDVQVEIQTHLKDQYIPKGEATYVIKRIGTPQKVGGFGSWAVNLEVDRKLYKKLVVRAKVSVVEDVVVAKDVIAKGATISEEDLAKVPKDISNEAADFTDNPGLVVGQQARRDIGKNESIRTHLVEEPVILEKGQPVRLVFQSAGVYLSNMAIAMRDGKKGDVIPVQILGNKKTVYAVVIDAKQVEVAL
ncbi:MAG: flagella basal body P-ring formation protein FlgA [Candidatus Lambdaproteobacteria bacterium RIFOXYD1_FULL_56_27]|uniref:Flagella basal body P-ring formation protein FlgA n=1 Tax=Candidatus Lambdaproteobacteria bacterium RIFOXYD2_FULL_56_26 TaxID=1817773 RepID=A0A1F6H3N0_9PROT|nr:MAG: flagella basal body P-ring formation protein FlgA [Candidatus Lambdaproteobacteria bacterium RIFOXYC1_FULL_56_13]OGH04973.1 MAG: flagella basal body P-ring formation protein FlgA [Candidatus Lambdaproteobacteria bacterium RIFOXYD2_FULL_56_26]OGH09438.1 MAG: flagella basal body P-ring formation protein FlgA [Candidatus Lambdaproteobacteria bacterium RIFOXYD1_FULL_56_27]